MNNFKKEETIIRRHYKNNDHQRSKNITCGNRLALILIRFDP